MCNAPINIVRLSHYVFISALLECYPDDLIKQSPNNKWPREANHKLTVDEVFLLEDQDSKNFEPAIHFSWSFPKDG